jgi:hypothetical protein
MVITTNHGPKMLDALKAHQEKVDASNCARKGHGYFMLRTSDPTFGHRGLKKLVDRGLVEIKPVPGGDCLVKLMEEE